MFSPIIATVCSNPVDSNKQFNLDNEEIKTGVFVNFVAFDPIPNLPLTLLPNV